MAREINSFLTCVCPSIECPLFLSQKYDNIMISIHLVKAVSNKGIDWAAIIKGDKINHRIYQHNSLIIVLIEKKNVNTHLIYGKLHNDEQCPPYASRLTNGHKWGQNLLTRENIGKNFHDKIDDRWYPHTQETRVSGPTAHPKNKLSHQRWLCFM